MRSTAPPTVHGLKALIDARALAVWSVFAVLLVTGCALAGHRVALRAGQQSLQETEQHRLDLIATGLDGQLARFDFLPSLLEMAPSVLKLLDSPADAPLRNEVNRYLSGINATAGAEMLYVLDRSGVALAAADWDLPGTTVGADLGFRPYVKDALAAGRGRFYGLGITSKRPGYYLSYALLSAGQPRGVAAVKVSLSDVEAAWGKLPGTVLLVDERGVVILSTRQAWKFRPLAQLPAATRTDIAQTRPYGDASLTPIDWRESERLADDAQIVRIEGVAQLASSRPVNSARWQLVVLENLAPVRAAARNVAITSALAACVVVLLSLVGWQRRRARQAMLANQVALQAAHDTLESRVVERTTALRKAQADLVHAEKMAALGQMSAGLVHELNQPLAAMRALSDNACVLIESRRDEEARGNLRRIGKLVDRLGKLTRQLKLFSRKWSGGAAPVPVVVRAVIASARELQAEHIRESGVEVELKIEPPALKVLADEAALEQVFVNLMDNAIDAMSDAPARRLRIDAQVQGGRCVVTISDSGPGIRDDILPRLFAPFVTSKAAGAGLGLGLLVSANIVRDFSGSLRGWNMEGGGACFEIELPLAPSMEQVGHG